MDIAIIGFAGKFPRAENVTEFYHRLSEGYDAVRKFTPTRLSSTSLPLDRKYLPLAFMEDVDCFDYTFFNISKAEAEQMDPRQRIMLEVAYHTFEHAGYSLDALKNSSTAVFLGDTRLDYYHHAKEFGPLLHLGNMSAVLAGRIARFFNLRGRCEMIDTTCSSSLVALAHACDELVLGNADIALAGGINLNLFPNENNEGLVDIAAPDGKAKVFSAEANGTGGGEAAGCVLVKRLQDALRDGDTVHAIIKGYCINQDGALSASLTAPDSIAQSEVIKGAWKKAAVDASDIGYIEAHGTGTKLGDPIEVEGITKAFRTYTSAKQFCALSAVKSNVGHTDSAAGIIGFIKAILSLKYKVLFPSVHYKTSNPFIDFLNSPVYVNTVLKPWPENTKGTRLAGVSSFGLMGTNCHVVVQEGPKQDHAKEDRANEDQVSHVFIFSAKSNESLKSYLKVFKTFVYQSPEISLYQLSFTLANGRNHFQYRTAVIANSREQLIARIDEVLSSDFLPAPRTNRLVFFYSSPHHINKYLQDELATDTDFMDLLARKRRNNNLPQEIAFYYAYATLLHRRGLQADVAIGDGNGKVIMHAIASDNILENEHLEKNVNTSNPIGVRLEKFLAAQQEAITFVDLFQCPEVNEFFKNYPIEPARLSYHYSRSDTPHNQLLANLYISGHEIPWHLQYKQVPFRCTLPNYQFEKKRAWLKPPTASTIDNINFTQRSWHEIKSQPQVRQPESTYLMVEDTVGFSKSLRQQMVKRHSTNFIVLSKGEYFNSQSRNQFQLRFTEEQDFLMLREHLFQSGDLRFKGIILCHDVSQEENSTSATESLLLVFAIYKTFIDRFSQKDFHVALINSLSEKIIDTDQLVASRYAMNGFIRSLLSTHPRLRLNCIDIPFTQADDVVLVDRVLSLLSADLPVLSTAIRDHRIFIPFIEHKDVPEGKMVNLTGGTFLITGGLTGVGYAIANYLAEQGAKRLIIIGRTTIGKTASRNEDREANLNTLKSKVGVDYFTVDVTDLAALSELKNRLQLKSEKFSGIVHAAGERIQHLPLTDYTSDTLLKEIGAKTIGTINLLNVFDHELFFLCTSSMNVHVPQRESIPYTYANSFMDAIAIAGKSSLLSINWPGWNEYPTKQGDADFFRELPVNEALHCFHQLLSLKHGNVGIAGNDWNAVRVNPFFTIIQPPAETERHLTSSRQVPETSDIAVMFSIWKEVLKAEIISPDDDFFDSGGHSLNAVQVINAIEDHWGVRIEMEHFYDYPTCKDLTACVSSLVNPQMKYNNVVDKLSRIWIDVLKTQSLTVSDDFFELGGHSLNATQVINEVEAVFGVRLEMENFYDSPSLAQLAQYIFSTANHTASEELIKDTPSSSMLSHTRLSHEQKRIWSASIIKGQDNSFNMYNVYEIEGELDLPALEHAFHAIVQKHDVLRINILMQSDEPVQCVHDFDLTRYRLSIFEGQDIEGLTTSLVRKIFDLEKDALIQLSVIRISERTHRVVLVLHHVLADGWSMEILFNELINFYNQARHGAIEWEPLKKQYWEYALHQPTKDSPRYQQLKQYWNNLFQIPSREYLKLPFDFERPKQMTKGGEVLSAPLDHNLSSNLNSFSVRNSYSNYMTMVSGLIVLLHHYFDQKDIIVGATLSGRQSKELEKQIGLHLNVVAMRILLNEKDALRDVTEKVKRCVLDTHAHGEYPFEHLIEDLKISPQLNQSPLFNVLIEYRDMNISVGDTNESLHGIIARRLDVKQDFSKYDLTFLIDKSSQGLMMSIEYSIDLFESGTIRSMLLKLPIIYEALATDPSFELANVDRLFLKKPVAKNKYEVNFKF